MSLLSSLALFATAEDALTLLIYVLIAVVIVVLIVALVRRLL